MFSDYDHLQASDGTGDAALMKVQTNRAPGSTTISVDTVTGVSQKFIATSGPLLSNGFIDPEHKTDFTGHLSGTSLVIDSIEPGSTDIGNNQGDVVAIKPTTGWSNRVASVIAAIAGVGTPLNATFGTLNSTSIVTTGNATIGGNIAITGISSLTSASVATGDSSNNITPTKQIFNVTALDKNITVQVPSFSAVDGLQGELQILDNGTARTLTWAAGWLAVGVTLPTSTVAGKYLYASYRYNVADGKYHVRGIARQ